MGLPELGENVDAVTGADARMWFIVWEEDKGAEKRSAAFRCGVEATEWIRLLLGLSRSLN